MDSFRNKLKSIFEKNPELREKFKKSEDVEDAYNILKDHLEGTSFEDFEQQIESVVSEFKRQTPSKRELSFEEMENVVGGVNWDVVGDVLEAEIKYGWNKFTNWLGF